MNELGPAARQARFAISRMEPYYTSYMFAECTSGFYHGRPISPQKLRQLGVDIDD